jgi:hypothetical protein
MTIEESVNLAGTPRTWGYIEAKDYKPAMRLARGLGST